MWTVRNLPYYLAIAGLFVLFKTAYTNFTTQSLQFLLVPVNKLIGIISGHAYTYLPGQGYYYPGLNMIIEKSCAGFSFMLICFVMLAFLLVSRSHRHVYKLTAIPVALLFAYVCAVFTNVSRIVISVFVLQHGGQYASIHYSRLHQVQGIFIYLVSLIAVYLFVTHLIKHTNLNEQSA
jgi:exosortase K